MVRMSLAGEVVFLRIFDLGGTLSMPEARRILGPMAQLAAIQPSRATPEYVSFAAPIPLNLASLNLALHTEDGDPVSISARLYEVGSLAVMLRFPLKGAKMSDLARYHSIQFSTQGNRVRRSEVFLRIVNSIKPMLKPALDEIFDVPVEAESYTTFCLVNVPGGTERVAAEERAQIAGLLISEPHAEKLSVGEIDDTLRNSSSYYRDDYVAADWDSALLIEPSGQYEDVLYIFEVANLQLLALRKYDLYLDSTLERGYDDFERLSKGPPIYTGRARDMLRELGAVRMDLAKVTDEVANTAKFFGDWYGARLYMGLAQKLHINDYHKVVEEKLATLNDLYQSVLSEIDRRQNLALEVMIVLLIVFEVLMAMFLKK
jgi:hypothetical protein